LLGSAGGLAVARSAGELGRRAGSGSDARAGLCGGGGAAAPIVIARTGCTTFGWGATLGDGEPAADGGEYGSP
jgi:hypothetical protein